MYCICMYLWAFTVLDLDNHPDHNKGTRLTHLALVERPSPYIIDPYIPPKSICNLPTRTINVAHLI